MKLAGQVFSALGVLAGLMVAAGAASAQDAVHLNPTTLNFHVNQGKSASQTVTLTNNAGSLVASISKIDIGPQCCGAGRFSVVSHPCGGTLMGGQTCTITVRFTAKGSKDPRSRKRTSKSISSSSESAKPPLLLSPEPSEAQTDNCVHVAADAFVRQRC